MYTVTILRPCNEMSNGSGREATRIKGDNGRPVQQPVFCSYLVCMARISVLVEGGRGISTLGSGHIMKMAHYPANRASLPLGACSSTASETCTKTGYLQENNCASNCQRAAAALLPLTMRQTFTMFTRVTLLAAFLPAIWAFSDTHPIIAWSSHA